MTKGFCFLVSWALMAWLGTANANNCDIAPASTCVPILVFPTCKSPEGNGTLVAKRVRPVLALHPDSREGDHDAIRVSSASP